MNIVVLIAILVLLGARAATPDQTGGAGTGGIPPIGIGGGCNEAKQVSMRKRILAFQAAGTGSYFELTQKSARSDWTGWTNRLAKMYFDMEYSSCPGYNTW